MLAYDRATLSRTTEAMSPKWSEVGRRMAYKDIHIRIAGSCDYANLHGKRDFGDATEATDLETGALY